MMVRWTKVGRRRVSCSWVQPTLPDRLTVYQVVGRSCRCCSYRKLLRLPVGGTSSIYMFHLPAGLVPCYPVYRPLPSFVRHGFRSAPPVASSLSFPLAGLPATPPAVPRPPITLGTTHGGCAALPAKLYLIVVPPLHKPFGYFKDPPVPLPAVSTAIDHSAVSTPNTTEECSVHPSIARNSLKIFDYAPLPSLSVRSRIVPASRCPEQNSTE